MRECECQKKESPQTGLLHRVVHRLLGEGGRKAAKPQASRLLQLTRPGSALLRKGELCVVSMTGERRICCAEGAAWVTLPGRFCDYILKAGESLSLRGEGKVIISAGSERSLVHVCNR